MKPESYYFSHDYHARNDRKLVKLRLKYRMTGIGIYWSIVEMLYEENGQILISEIPTISQDLREKESVVSSIINDFELFENDGKIFWSNSVKRRLDKRLDIKNKAIAAAEKRWRNADAMRTHSDGTALKESKKKRKVKGKVDLGDESPQPKKSFKEFTQKDFMDEVATHKDEYSKEILRGFYDYWIEPSAGNKMRFQLEKTWETGLRLKRWKDNDEKFSKPNTQKQYEPQSASVPLKKIS